MSLQGYLMYFLVFFYSTRIEPAQNDCGWGNLSLTTSVNRNQPLREMSFFRNGQDKADTRKNSFVFNQVDLLEIDAEI